MLAVVALLAAIAYLLTPLGASGPEGMPVGFRLNIRYLAPGLVLALDAARDPAELRRRAAGLAARHPGAALAVRLPGHPRGARGGERRAPRGDRHRPHPGHRSRWRSRWSPCRCCWSSSRAGALAPVPLAGIGLAAVIALAVFGRMAQTHYLDERYSSTAPDYPKTEQPAVELNQGLGAAYDWARHPQTCRIALSGTMGALFQYAALGRRLEQQRHLHRPARPARLLQRDPRVPGVDRRPQRRRTTTTSSRPRPTTRTTRPRTRRRCSAPGSHVRRNVAARRRRRPGRRLEGHRAARLRRPASPHFQTESCPPATK